MSFWLILIIFSYGFCFGYIFYREFHQLYGFNIYISFRYALITAIFSPLILIVEIMINVRERYKEIKCIREFKKGKWEKVDKSRIIWDNEDQFTKVENIKIKEFIGDFFPVLDEKYPDIIKGLHIYALNDPEDGESLKTMHIDIYDQGNMDKNTDYMYQINDSFDLDICPEWLTVFPHVIKKED